MENIKIYEAARCACEKLKTASTETKNAALNAIAAALKSNIELILSQNALDIACADENGVSKIMQDRLLLTKERILAIADDVIKVSRLSDPIGEVLDDYVTEAGLNVKRVRVPFGVIGAIYESRPNVTVDISALCLKTGNACILKGGKDADNSNRCLAKIIKEAIAPFIDANSVTLLKSDRSVIDELITATDYVDLVFPRGGKGLIDYVTKNATVPVIATGAGVCHIYVEKSADIKMAEKILLNAKTSRPSVCNAAETLLIDRAIAKTELKALAAALNKKGVTLHANGEALNYIDALPIEESGFYTEYHSLDMSVKIVDGVEHAIEHINRFGTHHSDCIVTTDDSAAKLFTDGVDSACVYVNASTRFTDGGCFGFGAELGISTQKLHARGPMGLREMTTYRYIIKGNGQTR